MGLTVCYPENHSTSLSAKHESMDMIAIAEKLGYSNDLCGYARVNLGFISKGDCESQKCLCRTMWFAAIIFAISL